MSASCIYTGSIRHRRLAPANEFRHSLVLAYLDLDELPTLLDGRFERPRCGFARFRRSDYHGDAGVALADAVRATVERHTGTRPRGPIRVLTHLRALGHCFNPVSFYYCMRPDAAGVEAILAEVTNTPWGERHAYVIHGQDAVRVLRTTVRKAMHVSPFMAMDHTYEIRATTPGSTLSVQIESTRAGKRVFDATLSLARRELTNSSVRRMVARYPLATARVLALIYVHAIGLRLKGARVHPHPST